MPRPVDRTVYYDLALDTQLAPADASLGRQDFLIPRAGNQFIRQAAGARAIYVAASGERNGFVDACAVDLLDDPRNLVITEFGQVQFEAPVVKHLRNKAFIRRLISQFLLVV